MFLLKRLPARRSELLFSLSFVFGFFGLAGLAHALNWGDLSYMLALLSLELILPLAMGVTAAGLLAGDPAVDILLTSHRPAWQILAERLLVVCTAGAIAGCAGLLLVNNWGMRLPKYGVDQIFIWLSPMLFCTGLANAVALLRGRTLDGALASMSVMGLSLILLPQVPRLCAGNPSLTDCAWWLVSPLMTLGNASDGFWPLNRLLWLGLGAALLGLSFTLGQHEERVIQEAPNE